MKALWCCCALLCLVVSTSTPARCQDEFSTHNRFVFAKNPWAKERDKMPVVRDAEHSVRNGQVNVHNNVVDPELLAKPAGRPETADESRFGQPRSILNVYSSMPVTSSPAASALRAIPGPREPEMRIDQQVRGRMIASARHSTDLGHPVRAAKNPRPLSTEKVCRVPIASKESQPLSAASYPRGFGFSGEDAESPVTVFSVEESKISVHGKLIRSR